MSPAACSSGPLAVERFVREWPNERDEVVGWQEHGEEVERQWQQKKEAEQCKKGGGSAERLEAEEEMALSVEIFQLEAKEEKEEKALSVEALRPEAKERREGSAAKRVRKQNRNDDGAHVSAAFRAIRHAAANHLTSARQAELLNDGEWKHAFSHLPKLDGKRLERPSKVDIGAFCNDAAISGLAKKAHELGQKSGSKAPPPPRNFFKLDTPSLLRLSERTPNKALKPVAQVISSDMTLCHLLAAMAWRIYVSAMSDEQALFEHLNFCHLALQQLPC